MERFLPAVPSVLGTPGRSVEHAPRQNPPQVAESDLEVVASLTLLRLSGASPSPPLKRKREDIDAEQKELTPPPPSAVAAQAVRPTRRRYLTVTDPQRVVRTSLFPPTTVVSLPVTDRANMDREYQSFNWPPAPDFVGPTTRGPTPLFIRPTGTSTRFYPSMPAEFGRQFRVTSASGLSPDVEAVDRLFRDVVQMVQLNAPSRAAVLPMTTSNGFHVSPAVVMQNVTSNGAGLTTITTRHVIPSSSLHQWVDTAHVEMERLYDRVRPLPRPVLRNELIHRSITNVLVMLFVLAQFSGTAAFNLTDVNTTVTNSTVSALSFTNLFAWGSFLSTSEVLGFPLVFILVSLLRALYFSRLVVALQPHWAALRAAGPFTSIRNFFLLFVYLSLIPFCVALCVTFPDSIVIIDSFPVTVAALLTLVRPYLPPSPRPTPRPLNYLTAGYECNPDPVIKLIHQDGSLAGYVPIAQRELHEYYQRGLTPGMFLYGVASPLWSLHTTKVSVTETPIPSSPMVATNGLPSCSVEVRTSDGRLLGIASRIKYNGMTPNSYVFVTADHVIPAETAFYFERDQVRTVTFTRSQLRTVLSSPELGLSGADIFVFSADKRFTSEFSSLGVTASALGSPKTNVLHSMFGYKDDLICQSSFGAYQTMTPLHVTYTGSTLPGWSGTPAIYRGDVITSIHIGALPDSSANYGFSALALTSLLSRTVKPSPIEKGGNKDMSQEEFKDHWNDFEPDDYDRNRRDDDDDGDAADDYDQRAEDYDDKYDSNWGPGNDNWSSDEEYENRRQHKGDRYELSTGFPFDFAAKFHHLYVTAARVLILTGTNQHTVPKVPSPDMLYTSPEAFAALSHKCEQAKNFKRFISELAIGGPRDIQPDVVDIPPAFSVSQVRKALAKVWRQEKLTSEFPVQPVLTETGLTEEKLKLKFASGAFLLYDPVIFQDPALSWAGSVNLCRVCKEKSFGPTCRIAEFICLSCYKTVFECVGPKLLTDFPFTAEVSHALPAPNAPSFTIRYIIDPEVKQFLTLNLKGPHAAILREKLFDEHKPKLYLDTRPTLMWTDKAFKKTDVISHVVDPLIPPPVLPALRVEVSPPKPQQKKAEKNSPGARIAEHEVFIEQAKLALQTVTNKSLREVMQTQIKSHEEAIMVLKGKLVTDAPPSSSSKLENTVPVHSPAQPSSASPTETTDEEVPLKGRRAPPGALQRGPILPTPTTSPAMLTESSMSGSPLVLTETELALIRRLTSNLLATPTVSTSQSTALTQTPYKKLDSSTPPSATTAPPSAERERSSTPSASKPRSGRDAKRRR